MRTYVLRNGKGRVAQPVAVRSSQYRLQYDVLSTLYLLLSESTARNTDYCKSVLTYRTVKQLNKRAIFSGCNYYSRPSTLEGLVNFSFLSR